ncbi:MAG: hypothetical protein KZQ94_20970 [Candidatus Thiodiazotropha sp. (ex Troendleina suluensis)]|nr:hypothetical protein [Candidatus Thiodiazotropha sp. (ex Troendleina suluensis)]
MMHISKKKILNDVCRKWWSMKNSYSWEGGNYQYFHALSILLIGVDNELSDDLSFLTEMAIFQEDMLWEGRS